jgi:chromate reductase, NAD(P)H dehydrogenase (quinone)
VAKTIHVLGIAGSLRKTSYNRGALRAALELLPEGVELETYDLADLPMYNDDTQGEDAPEAVKRFKAKVAEADALLLATPEYNWSVPALLKNAIDWASRQPNVLEGKPIALMGASVGNFGTVRVQMHWRQIFAYTGSFVLVKPDVFIFRAQERFDAEGNLTDESTRQQISALLEALHLWVRRLYPE